VVFPTLVLVGFLGVQSQFGADLGRGPQSTVTFDNRSGKDALVKLVGPSNQAVAVPNGDFKTVNVAAGSYSILVRYGSSLTDYSYIQGDPFTVSESAVEHSAVMITLHPVTGGNYVGHPTTSGLFDAIGGGAQVATQPPPLTVSFIAGHPHRQGWPAGDLRIGNGVIRYDTDAKHSFVVNLADVKEVRANSMIVFGLIPPPFHIRLKNGKIYELYLLNESRQMVRPDLAIEAIDRAIAQK